MHRIEVRIVSKKYLNRLLADKGETVSAAFAYEENIIYLSKEHSKEELLHDLMHELYHAFERHSARADSEASADMHASWLIKLFKIDSIEQLIEGLK